MRLLVYVIFPASGLIAVTALLRALFLERLPKRLFTFLWLVAALRLALPPSLHLFLPGFSSTPAALTAYLAATAIPGQLSQAGVSMPTPSLALNWAHVFYIIWVIGALSLAAWFISSHLCCVRRYREALPAQNPLVHAIVRGFGLRRTVLVKVCQAVASPLTYGVFRPVILLPKELEYAPAQELEHILTHELVHIRRLHVAYKYLLAAVVCLHWFNPLVWLMYALACRDIELSCDEGAVGRLSGKRADYAMTLLNLEQARADGPLLGFGGSTVRERIQMIARYKKPGVLALALAVALVLCSTTVFASSVDVLTGDVVIQPVVTPSPIFALAKPTPSPIPMVETVTYDAYATAVPIVEYSVYATPAPTLVPGMDAIYAPVSTPVVVFGEDGGIYGYQPASEDSYGGIEPEPLATLIPVLTPVGE